MKTKTLKIKVLWFLAIITGIMVGCSPPTSGLGPSGPVGPQGPLGPQGDIGPSSSDLPKDAILIEATDVLVEREYPFSGFSEIEVSDLFVVEIRQGETFRVLVEAEDTITPYHDIFVEGKTLHIGLNPNFTYNIESTSQRVEVTLPHLTGVEVDDLSEVTIHAFRSSGNLQITVTDLSSLSANITSNSIEVDIREHSSLDLAGVVQEVSGSVEVMSELDLSMLNAQRVTVISDQFSEIKE
jgi:hypothetical protein